MSDFDPFDDELGAALRRRAGTGPASTGAAHDAVLQRAGTIRRRRAAIGGGSAMAVLLIGGIALLPSGGDEIGPADSGDVLPTFEEATDSTTSPTTVDLTIPAPAPGTEASTPTSTDAPESPASPTTDDPDATAPATTAPAPSLPTTSLPTTSLPTTSLPTTSLPTTSAGSTPTTAPSTTTEPTVPTLDPFTETYQSAGGSITVSWNGSALTLQSVSPASGFVADVEQSTTTRVRVAFESDVDDSRIEVRVDGGQLNVDID